MHGPQLDSFGEVAIFSIVKELATDPTYIFSSQIALCLQAASVVMMTRVGLEEGSGDFPFIP